MDTITTIQGLLKFNGSAHPVTVALMPNETRLIAAAPDLYEALADLVENKCSEHCDWEAARAALAAVRGGE